MKKVNLKNISKRIKELRISNSITQKELAKMLGVPQPIMSYYETGARIPNLEILIMLSEIFNCSIDYLVKGIKDSSEGYYIKQKTTAYKIIDSLSLKNKEIVIDLAKKLKNK